METGNFLKMLNDASLASLGILMWKVLGCTICKNPLWVLSCKVNPLRCQTNNAISEVSKGDCIIMGDFNHGNIKWDTLQSTGVEDQQFLCLVQDNFLTQHVLEPTRATRVLYIVLSSQKEFADNVEIKEPLGSSDHNQMHFNIIIKSDKPKVQRWRRDF